MELVDVKLTKDESKDLGIGAAPHAPKGPHYPWGLSITLDTPTLEKLGIKNLPKPGEEFRLEAICLVTDVHDGKRLKEEPERSVRLQITELGCEVEKKNGRNKGQAYYGRKRH